jgi:anti-anti-sigma factor
VTSIGGELERQGDRVALRLVGDLDYRRSDQVVATTDRQLQDPSVTALDLDLRALGYCDSTGLGALIAIHTRTADRGVVLTLLDPPQVLRRLLTLTGLDAYFVIRGEADGAGVR